MGIIDKIKQTASNVARGAANMVTGKNKPKAHVQKEYRQVRQIDDETTETTVSDQPIKKPFSESVSKKVEQHNQLAATVLGTGKTLATKAGGAVKSVIQKASHPVQTTHEAQAFVEKKAPRVAKFAKQSVAEVRKNPMVQTFQKRSIRGDMDVGGNMFIQAFTGKDPAKQYARISKRKSKKTDLGSKISKKEAKILQKHYGKNWRMAISKNKRGDYFSSDINMIAIRRENALDRTSVNFGSAFPEPNQFISSEFSRQPFQPRSSDPMDIEANFMGERGSGFTKKRDPFAIQGFKL